MPRQLSQIKLTLMQAGYRHRDAVRYFHFAQMALGNLASDPRLLYFLLFKAGGEDHDHPDDHVYPGPGLVGYMIPEILGHQTPPAASAGNRGRFSGLAST